MVSPSAGPEIALFENPQRHIKLVPAKQVQRFAEQYVAATVIAKHFNLSGSSLARYLRVGHAGARGLDT